MTLQNTGHGLMGMIDEARPNSNKSSDHDDGVELMDEDEQVDDEQVDEVSIYGVQAISIDAGPISDATGIETTSPPEEVETANQSMPENIRQADESRTDTPSIMPEQYVMAVDSHIVNHDEAPTPHASDTPFMDNNRATMALHEDEEDEDTNVDPYGSSLIMGSISEDEPAPTHFASLRSAKDRARRALEDAKRRVATGKLKQQAEMFTSEMNVASGITSPPGITSPRHIPPARLEKMMQGNTLDQYLVDSNGSISGGMYIDGHDSDNYTLFSEGELAEMAKGSFAVKQIPASKESDHHRTASFFQFEAPVIHEEMVAATAPGQLMTTTMITKEASESIVAEQVNLEATSPGTQRAETSLSPPIARKETTVLQEDKIESTMNQPVNPESASPFTHEMKPLTHPTIARKETTSMQEENIESTMNQPGVRAISDDAGPNSDETRVLVETTSPLEEAETASQSMPENVRQTGDNRTDNSIVMPEQDVMADQSHVVNHDEALTSYVIGTSFTDNSRETMILHEDEDEDANMDPFGSSLIMGSISEDEPGPTHFASLRSAKERAKRALEDAKRRVATGKLKQQAEMFTSEMNVASGITSPPGITSPRHIPPARLEKMMQGNTLDQYLVDSNGSISGGMYIDGHDSDNYTLFSEGELAEMAKGSFAVKQIPASKESDHHRTASFFQFEAPVIHEEMVAATAPGQLMTTTMITKEASESIVAEQVNLEATSPGTQGAETSLLPPIARKETTVLQEDKIESTMNQPVNPESASPANCEEKPLIHPTSTIARKEKNLLHEKTIEATLNQPANPDVISPMTNKMKSWISPKIDKKKIFAFTRSDSPDPEVVSSTATTKGKSWMPPKIDRMASGSPMASSKKSWKELLRSSPVARVARKKSQGPQGKNMVNEFLGPGVVPSVEKEVANLQIPEASIVPSISSQTSHSEGKIGKKDKIENDKSHHSQPERPIVLTSMQMRQETRARHRAGPRPVVSGIQKGKIKPRDNKESRTRVQRGNRRQTARTNDNVVLGSGPRELTKTDAGGDLNSDAAPKKGNMPLLNRRRKSLDNATISAVSDDIPNSPSRIRVHRGNRSARSSDNDVVGMEAIELAKADAEVDLNSKAAPKAVVPVVDRRRKSLDNATIPAVKDPIPHSPSRTNRRTPGPRRPVPSHHRPSRQTGRDGEKRGSRLSRSPIRHTSDRTSDRGQTTTSRSKSADKTAANEVAGQSTSMTEHYRPSRRGRKSHSPVPPQRRHQSDNSTAASSPQQGAHKINARRRARGGTWGSERDTNGETGATKPARRRGSRGSQLPAPPPMK
ncbi:unnamed protein product [Cylindrotheca closterium]|uniref:Uncharacterized protein n=1 Tax=Cylindrotheca closterium TaxID=2856 RepID=A0AAD2CKC5_9STRA|nr:unnamed protein product [Cylindrotheca closterium]